MNGSTRKICSNRCLLLIFDVGKQSCKCLSCLSIHFFNIGRDLDEFFFSLRVLVPDSTFLMKIEKYERRALKTKEIGMKEGRKRHSSKTSQHSKRFKEIILVSFFTFFFEKNAENMV
eukprot:GDKJ01020199.1.p1 GENE.GDKJ01020199.1~~GDKJ01020199.1.p1  ORF type:complete len:117 (+),score=24.56 GDKJ01020199.1:1421-1771(+)